MEHHQPRSRARAEVTAADVSTTAADARDRIERALKNSQARFTEIRLEQTATTRVVFRGKNLDAVAETLDRGGIVRCLAPEGGWGTATFNDWDLLDKKVAEALACARAVPVREGLARRDRAGERGAASHLTQDFRGPSRSRRRSTRSAPTTRSCSPSPRSARPRRSTATPSRPSTTGTLNGAWIVEERPLVDLYARRRGGPRRRRPERRASRTRSPNRGFDAVLGREELARSRRRAARASSLDAKPVQAASTPSSRTRRSPASSSTRPSGTSPRPTSPSRTRTSRR